MIGKNGSDEAPKVKVEDRRRFRDADVTDEGELPSPTAEEAAEEVPIETADAEKAALLARAEGAERKLAEFQIAYSTWKAEQEQVRARLERDLARKVDLRFGDLAVDGRTVVDDLDLAVEHAAGVPEAGALATGVTMARDRFLTAIQKLGVERLDLDGAEFDPNVAEAVAVVPAASPEADGKIAKTLQPGYRLGDRVIRPARVVVSRLPS